MCVIESPFDSRWGCEPYEHEPHKGKPLHCLLYVAAVTRVEWFSFMALNLLYRPFHALAELAFHSEAWRVPKKTYDLSFISVFPVTDVHNHPSASCQIPAFSELFCL